MIKHTKLILIFCLTMALAACAQTTPQTNPDSKKALKADYQSIVDNNIIKAANQKHITNNGGVNGDFLVNLRLNGLIERLVLKNGLSAKTIKPILLKSATVNAYSLSSQSVFAYVYVTNGLITFVNNDDQLAAVLAHEISHIILGHHLARQKNSSSQFNQKQELEADEYSIKLLANAGFNTTEVIKLLQRLDIFQANQSFTNRQDYPSNKARINALSRVIAAL